MSAAPQSRSVSTAHSATSALALSTAFDAPPAPAADTLGRVGRASRSIAPPDMVTMPFPPHAPSREDADPAPVGRAFGEDRMTAGTPGEVPPGTVEISLDRISVRHFTAVFVSVGSARRHTAETMRSWALEEITETAVLLASELVTNAIKATIAPARRLGCDEVRDRRTDVALRLGSTTTRLLIEVWDHDDTPPVLETRDLTEEGGRGLLLVDVLSSRWAYYRPRSGGKVVWCEVDLSVPAVAADEQHETCRLLCRDSSTEQSDWFG